METQQSPEIRQEETGIRMGQKDHTQRVWITRSKLCQTQCAPSMETQQSPEIGQEETGIRMGQNNHT
eukprot:12825221-Ditylum_brightwellii.AAC.2